MLIISDTQKRIIDAFFLVAKDCGTIKKITVQRVAERAGLTRSSIYKYHFDSIDDIISKVHLLIDEEIQDEFNSYITGNEKNLVLFLSKNTLQALYDKRDWLKVLYGTNIDPEWKSFLGSRYSPLIKLYLEKIGKDEIISNDVLAKLVINEFLSIISLWITSDNPEPPSLFQKKFLYLMGASPAQILSSANVKSR